MPSIKDLANSLFMKRILNLTIFTFSLLATPLWASNIDKALESPTSYFRELGKTLLQTPITWNSPSNDLDQLKVNTKKFFKVLSAVKKQSHFNNSFGDRLSDVIASSSVLNGHELHLLGQILSSTHALSARLLEFSSLYNIEDQKNAGKVIDLKDLNLTQRNLIWLSSHITLFGLYRDGYIHYYKEVNLRRIVKNILKADSKKNNKLKEIGGMLTHTSSKKNRKVLREHLISFLQDLPELKRRATSNQEILTLIESIEGNKVTKAILSDKNLTFRSHSFADSFVSFLGRAMNIISAFFGNSVGMVKWRKGFLINSKETVSRLKADLRPLDIIFEKTPFALTDLFIPGNFGHVAVYIGTQAQLKEIGMWNHPRVVPYHKQLRSGHVIVEALRAGVRTASIEEWMNIDEILILRSPTVLKDNQEEVARMFTRIMNQIGKKYDFNFDVTTTDKIVCSELIFHAFGKINWPTKYIMGRSTVTPDDLAELALYKNSPLNFDTYIFSPKRGKVRDLTIEELASKLGFRKNVEKSTKENQSFDKVYKKCRKIKRRFRQGSHRNKYRTIRVCKTIYKELDYKNLERTHTIDKRHSADGNH